MQDTSLINKVIIVDDHSSDNSVLKISSFCERNAHLRFECIVNTENVGPFIALKTALQAVESEFVAFLEGDDYWVDKKKLSLQLEFLKENAGYAGIGANSYIVDNEGSRSGNNFGNAMSTTLHAKDVIEVPPFQLSTLLCRIKYLMAFPEGFEGTFSNDKLVYVLLTINKPIYYSSEVSSAYRLNAHGITFSAGEQARYNEQVYFYQKLDVLLRGAYSKNIHNAIFRHQIGHLQSAIRKKEPFKISNFSIFITWIKAKKGFKLNGFKELLYAIKLNVWRR